MKDCPGVDGLSCIRGWLYSSIGGMIFPANRKCSACNADTGSAGSETEEEHPLGPPPTEGCVCWACVATRALQASRMELVKMTARNIELGVKVQDKQRDLDLAIERANKVSGRLKLERALSNDALIENKILHEQIAALESKEVCNLPHDDTIIEGCVYCKLEAARIEILELRGGPEG